MLVTLPNRKQSREDIPVLLLAVVLTVGIFALDLLTPLAWADGFLYLVPLILIFFHSPRQYHLVGFASLCSGLIMLGWLLSPPGGTAGQVTYNRTMGITLLWVTALFLRHRKRAEAALCLLQEESEERFRLLWDHANDAIFFIDLHGQIQWASRQATVVTGLTSAKLFGRSILTMLSPASAAKAEARLAVVRRGEAVPPLVDLEFLHPDGSTVLTEASIASVQREGTVVGRLMVARDLRDRKQAEEALRLSNQRLQSALKASKIGLWEWNVRTNETVFSPEWKSQLGYAEHEILNRREEWVSRLHPDDRDGVLSRLAAYLENPVGDYQAEFRLRHKDGAYRWIFTRALLIKDGAGEPLRMRGSHLDVTERKLNEEAQRKRDHALRVQNAAFVELARTKTLYTGDFRRALMSLTEMAGRTMQCERVGMWLFNEDHSVIHCQDLYELSANSHSQGQSLTAADYPAYFMALDEIRSLAVNEVHLDPQTKEFALSYLAPLGVTSKLDAPIRLNGRTVGVICHEHVGPTRCWSLEDQQFAGSMADWVSIALEASELKRTEEALRKSEQELRRALDERERLSQDLHDNVMQTIYAIGLGLEECWRIAQKGAPLIATKMQETIGDLNALIQDIRGYIVGVEPRVSGGIQLAKELTRLVQTTGRCDTLGFHLKLDSMALQRLSGEQASHILFIAREAISNSVRHSRAQTGTLSLWQLGDTVRFEVRDDGTGFRSEDTRSDGNGLRNIAARVEKLGGILKITSEAGNGVGIVVDILLERERVTF